MKQYDIAFSLGRACSCTETLRKAGLQYLSFPWDWTGVEGGAPDILDRALITQSGFNGWMDMDDFVFSHQEGGTGKDRYVNKRTGLIYNHDFPKGVPLAESYPTVKEKYDRRIARFLNLLKAAKHALIVCIDMPVQTAPTSIEDCRKARRIFAEMFPNARFDLVLFNLEPGRRPENRVEETIEDGFMRFSFDYKDYTPGKPSYAIVLDKTAAVLKSFVSVRDYRTKKEIDALRKRTQMAKMREAGAANAWQYFLIRRRGDFLRLANRFSPRILLARLRSKRFDHVLSLGVNCDVGFRFCQKWGFVDSTPFTWSQTFDIDHLIQAIRNPDEIGAGGFTWHEPTRMWKCNATGIYFHGRMKATSDQPTPDEAMLKADLKELISRLEYLKKKLVAVAADDSRKAFIYRIKSSEAQTNDINRKLDELQHALENLGARNYLLVIVAEKKTKGLLLPSSNREIRYVKAFNPQDRVTTATIGDPVGWNAIFTEFAPAVVKAATHKFKFE